MSVLVLLLANDNPAAEVGPGVTQDLAALGVTTVSLLRDEHTTAVALEGWAFDPNRSAEAAARAVTNDPAAIRILHPVVESAVYPASNPRSRKRSTR